MSVGFFTQPFFTTEQFTGHAGKLVSLKDALDGCERILKDEFKDYPEQSFYMIGTIAEVKELVKKPKNTAENNQTKKANNASELNESKNSG